MIDKYIGPNIEIALYSDHIEIWSSLEIRRIIWSLPFWKIARKGTRLSSVIYEFHDGVDIYEAWQIVLVGVEDYLDSEEA